MQFIEIKGKKKELKLNCGTRWSADKWLKQNGEDRTLMLIYFDLLRSIDKHKNEGMHIQLASVNFYDCGILIWGALLHENKLLTPSDVQDMFSEGDFNALVPIVETVIAAYSEAMPDKKPKESGSDEKKTKPTSKLPKGKSSK